MLVRKLEQFMVFEGVSAPLPLMSTQQVLKPAFQEVKVLPTEICIFGKHFNYGAIGIDDWHMDIFSGKRFPLTFSKGIDIRKDPGLSAKTVWEVNRMQFLLPLAIQYKQTSDRSLLDMFMQTIRSWNASNPYLRGVNWYSNIEVNLRLINWFLCWEVLNADALARKNTAFHSFVTEEWLPSIKLHCNYSYENPSRYSSANNHLIAEYAGLFIAAVKWPFRDSAKWARYAQDGLEKEILNQHSERGVNKEEAAEYIQFITDFFLLSYVVGKNVGRPFSRTFEERLQQVIEYIFTFLDSKGAFPKYGDEDDGKCFQVELDAHFNNFRSILTSGALLFDKPLWKAKSGGYDRKNQLLFGEEGRKKFNSVDTVPLKEESAFYPEEGHFICRTKNRDREIYFHFDAAPLGFLSIAAHGHADALSFILHVDGQPVLVDPGTYTYHTEPEWRKYFVSTLAHNTICIDRSDQADFSGTTLWLNHYQCMVHRSEVGKSQDVIEASHNGYRNFGIIHRRQVEFDKVDMKFTITDFITSSHEGREYQLQMPFHLHPDIALSTHGSHVYLLKTSNGCEVEMCLDDRLRTLRLGGQSDPYKAGWYSDSFLVKQSTKTIMGSLRFSGDISLKTIIAIKPS